MASRKVKFEVGQTWKSGGVEYTITKISNGWTYYVDYGLSQFFCAVDQNNEATLDDYFQLVDAPITNESLPKQQQDILSFFKSVAEGNCPCNILRSQCDFHKLQ